MTRAKFNGVITSISSRKDKSLRLSVGTPELSNEERALFMEYQGINSDFTIEPLDEVVSEEDMIIDAVEGTKTPSQRLRAVLYVLWNQKGSEGLFSDFYMRSMEKFIEHIKSKLED